MKKLLLLGALLVVGATSFAYDQVKSLGVVSDSGTGGSNPDAVHSKEESVGLFLRSKGSVVAPAENEYILQITPTKTSETSTDSIVFDFTGLAPGVTKVVDGAFKAQIFKGKAGGEAELVNIPKDTDGSLMISSILQKNGADVGGVVEIDLMGATASADTEVGKLTYTLTSQLADAQTYTGNIKAELAVAADAESSTFNDSSAGVVVTVEAEAFKGNVLP